MNQKLNNYLLTTTSHAVLDYRLQQIMFDKYRKMLITKDRVKKKLALAKHFHKQQEIINGQG